MKTIVFNYLLLLTFFVLLSNCKHSTKPITATERHVYTISANANVKNLESTTLVLLDSTTFNFHNIKAGEMVKHTFHFRNNGNSPLIIASATATCGCTVASFNKNPILPGRTDSIVAIFSSTKDMVGFQNKVVAVNYNSLGSPKLLTLYGHVN